MKACRVAAVVCAALLACALVCSLVFIIVEAHHDCSGEDCPVCAQIALCRDALRRLSRAFFALLAVTVLSTAFASASATPASDFCFFTPVAAGVKLLN